MALLQKLVFMFFLLALIGCDFSLAAEITTKEEKKMDRVEAMEINRQKLLGDVPLDNLAKTDPDLAQIRDRLVFGEIYNSGTLDDKQRVLISISALTAKQAENALPGHVIMALSAGATPVEICETIYQITPYIGFPAAEAALKIVDDAFAKDDIKADLESQATVTEQTRFKDGLAVQKKIFGAANIEKMQESAPAGQQDIVTNYLSAFCFGDFYTRKGLDLKMRELVTFSAIVALGGCDPQARAHASANIKVGNTKQNLVDALATMLPYIGFPRTLNGLAAVNAAVPEKSEKK